MNTLKNQEGYGTIEFILLFAIIVFMLFSGVDYYVAQARYGILEQIKEESLDRMRVEGWLTYTEQNAIQTKLENMGYSDIVIEGSLEGAISSPVARDVKNSELAFVTLTITAKPKETPFLFGKLVGSEQEGEYVIKVGGEALSERPASY